MDPDPVSDPAPPPAGVATGAAATGAPVPSGASGRRVAGRELAFGIGMLVPAFVLLGGLVVYPVFAIVVRSLYDRRGDEFIGIDNYRTIFDRDSTREALANNIVWVVVAPALVTAVGLVFAVLTQRVRFGTAFKIVVFMPMAISFLAAGVIFRFVYEQDPDRGLADAVATSIEGLWDDGGAYAGARPSVPDAVPAEGEAFVMASPVGLGGSVEVGLVGIRPADVGGGSSPAVAPEVEPDAITGVVWLDLGVSGGERGQLDEGELGLRGVSLAALDASGRVAAHASTDAQGRFHFDGLSPGEYRVRLDASNFQGAWSGWLWLGTTDVTPIGPAVVTLSVILAYLWIWAGFAMVVIAAGLAAIPTEVQEAARVDGAGEWQVFRRVTIPLLWPVLLVVLVTLVINVLKIFDLVLVIPPGSSQADANVIALELWRVSFGGGRDEGLGSALAVLLFLLVVPFMAWNIRRFRVEER